MSERLIWMYGCIMRKEIVGGFSLSLNHGTVEAASQNEAVGAMLELVQQQLEGTWQLYSHSVSPMKARVARRALELISLHDNPPSDG